MVNPLAAGVEVGGIPGTSPRRRGDIADPRHAGQALHQEAISAESRCREPRQNPRRIANVGDVPPIADGIPSKASDFFQQTLTVGDDVEKRSRLIGQPREASGHVWMGWCRGRRDSR